MDFDWKEFAQKLYKKLLQLLHHPKTPKILLWVLVGLLAVVFAVIIVALINIYKPDLTEGKTSTITLVAGGDLNITEKTVASGGEDHDYSRVFSSVAEIFAQADGAMLNLEGNFCGEPYGATGSAPQSLATQLSAMGVDFIQTANSYSIKNGMSGLTQTLSTVQNAGMTPLGTYASNGDFSKQQGYVLRSIGGIKIAFVAFTKGMDNMTLPTGSENCVNLLYTDTTTYKTINTEGITSILDAVADAKPDITIALVHWGSENNTTVSSSQKKIANLMLQNGVDAIIGTHSHQVQSIEYDARERTLIAYSLGDFYGDAVNAGNQYSILLEIRITKNHTTGEIGISGFDYVPIYTLTPDRDGEDMRVVQIQPALEAYENGDLLRVSETAYNNMKSALELIKSKTAPADE